MPLSQLEEIRLGNADAAPHENQEALSGTIGAQAGQPLMPYSQNRSVRNHTYDGKFTTIYFSVDRLPSVVFGLIRREF
jgi:hypothetical protein